MVLKPFGVAKPARRAVAPYALAALACLLLSGCISTGRVESTGADLLDLIARQTGATFDEYERDLLALDADRRQGVVQNLAERVKRDGAERVDAHAAALLDALEKIAADRQTARRRYEAAMDNVELLREVAGGLRRYGQRLRDLRGRLEAFLQAAQE